MDYDVNDIGEVQDLTETEEPIVEVPVNWAYPKIFQTTVELNDGTVMNGFAQKSPYSNEIYIYPDGMNHTYIELVTLFGDPERTQAIHAHMSENETVTYTGYTHLGSITADNNGKYTITMRQL